MTERDLEIQELRRELEGMTKMQKMLAMFTEATNGVPLKRIRELAQADREGRCVVLPCKVSDAIDTMFSHNEIIALWYDRPKDGDHSYLLWRGEAWRLPKKYKDQRILRFKGIIPEKISEADTINLLVTPYISPAYEEAEAGLEAQKGAEHETD